ncbi:MAG: ribosomal protection-like ABC-F family protein [Anaerolineales bacterium]
MLTVHNISKSFNIKDVLKNISFNINPADRIGLIGPNGSGKTTLLKIILGKLQPDQGTITRNPKDLELGYLAQALDFEDVSTIGELVAQVGGNPEKLERDLESLSLAMTAQPENEDLQAAFDETLNKLETFSTPRVHPAVILESFDLAKIPENTPVSKLSGGQKTRLGLVLLLISDPDLIILDEPTNHLDIRMLEWLERWLKDFKGGALIVSHDRTFLDNTVNRIIDLDPSDHTIKEYQGNYSQYLEQYLSQEEKQLAAYRDQVYEIRRIRQDIAQTKRQAFHVELTTTSRQPNVRRYAKKVARKAKSREKKLERYLESDDRIEKPKQSWQMNLAFKEREHQSQDVLILEDLTIGYTANSPLIKNLNRYIQAGSRIALTGPNGSGKTTLLRTIAGQLQPLTGAVRLGRNIRLGYMTQEQELLSDQLNALETIQSQAPGSETDLRSFLHFFLFTGDEVMVPVKDLSFGERSRLELALLVAKGCDFLLLDEPINHLDIPSRSRFEQALSQYPGTILAVVHDRYFIQRFASEIWSLDESGTLTVRPN